MYHTARSDGKAPTLTVSVLHELAELERMRADWERLLARSAGLHPSLTPTWMLTWWRVFGSDDPGRRLHAGVPAFARVSP